MNPLTAWYRVLLGATRRGSCYRVIYEYPGLYEKIKLNWTEYFHAFPNLNWIYAELVTAGIVDYLMENDLLEELPGEEDDAS